MAASAVALGVGAAAMAASTAMQATQGGPDIPALQGASGMEARMRRRNRDLLFDAELMTRRGIFEQNMLTPDWYRLAGYDVEYDQESIAAAAAARERAQQAVNRFHEARAVRDQFIGDAWRATRRKRLEGLKGKERRRALKELKKEKRQTLENLRIAKQEMDTAVANAGQLETSAGRITRITRRGGGAAVSDDPFGAVGDGPDIGAEIDRLMGERALQALKTGESSDPRLLRELAEQEGEIRARLARQFGPDYENTTAGQMALNAFRQRRAESLADFARRDIEFERERLGLRGRRLALAGAQLNLAQLPVQAQFTAGETLGNLAGRFQNFSEMLQQDRLAMHGAKVEKAMAEHDAEVQRTQAIAGSLSQLAKGASSFGLSMFG